MSADQWRSARSAAIVASATCVFLAMLLATASAQVAAPEDAAPARVQYTIELKNAATHLVHVRMQIPDGTPQHEIQLPVWNATYMVRDFAQYVNHIAARASDRALPLNQITGSSWRVQGCEHGCTIEYDDTLDIAGPFGAQFSDKHAFFNLALLLMYAPDLRTLPVAVKFEGAPPGWQLATPLRSLDGTCQGQTGIACQYVAANYDRLVDGPVEIGRWADTGFEEGGAKYRVVVDAEPGDYDLNSIVPMLRKIVTAETAWMNDRPFDHYTFFYHFPRGPAGGGMEHAYGTAIDASAGRVKQDPNSLANVSAHEFFHLWNVKRIRPQSLEPVDYTKVQYTRALWFSEGVTSTVAEYALLRAGLHDEVGFLESLSRTIQQEESRPADRTMSAEESSLTTWFDKYPDYHAPERSISYYTKGEILGVLLDLAMLDATDGHKGLRDLFQYLNQQYARQGCFFDDSAGVRDAAELLTGHSFHEFFEKYVAGTAQVPYDDFFRSVGLRLTKTRATVADPGFTLARTRNQQGVAVVSVEPGSDAEKAGLLADDVIVSANGAPAYSERQFARFKPGETLKVKILHQGMPRELALKLGSRTEDQYRLVDVETVTPAQRMRRAIWLGSSAPATAVSPGSPGSCPPFSGAALPQ